MMLIIGKNGGSVLKRIWEFQLLRVFMAFVVFLFHLRLNFNMDFYFTSLNTFIEVGNILMVGFFILSGFVLYYDFDYELSEKPLTIDMLKQKTSVFYKKRISSIYPLYWSLCILIICINWRLFALYQQNILAAPIQFLGLQGFLTGFSSFWGNDALWFVSVLVILYAIFSICYASLNGFNSFKLKILLFLTWGWATYITILQAFFGVFTYSKPLCRLPEFLFGMILCAIYKKTERVYKKGRVLFIALFFFYGVNFLSHLKFLNDLYFYQNPSYFNFFTIPCLGALIYETACNENKYILKVAKKSLIKYFSDLTYAFYLVQFITVLILWKYFIYLESKTLFFIIALLINFILSNAGHYLIEVPCKKVMNYLLFK